VGAQTRGNSNDGARLGHTADLDRRGHGARGPSVKLRAGFSEPLHDGVKTRILADGIDETTAESAADAIVGGVVYPILSGAQAYSLPRAELATRIIVDSLIRGR